MSWKNPEEAVREDLARAAFIAQHEATPVWMRGKPVPAPKPLYIEELRRTKAQISHASHCHKSLDAVRQLERLANHVQSALDMVEAKLRIHVSTLPRPQTAAVPESLERTLEDLHASGISADIITQTRNLVCTALCEVADGLEADIDLGSRGSVEVTWRDLPFQSRWLIFRSRIPWPGIYVRVIFSETEHSTTEHSTFSHRSFWSAPTLMEHFRSLLERHGK